MSLTWKDDLLTGFMEVDAQHRAFFNLINQLYNACSHGKGRGELQHVFQFLDNYIKFHFNTEESYMINYNYPGIIFHKLKHTSFKKDFAELKKKPIDSYSGLLTLLETNRLLGEWWVNHINNEDKEMGKFLKSKVIQLPSPLQIERRIQSKLVPIYDRIGIPLKKGA